MVDRAMRLLQTTLEVLTIAGAASVVFLFGAFAAKAMFPPDDPAHSAPIRPESIFTEAELSEHYTMRQTLNTMIYDLEVSLGYAPNYDEHEATYVLEFYSDYKCEE